LSFSENVEIAKKLCMAPQVDVNLQKNNGYSPLMVACFKGRTELVQYFLEICPKFFDINLHTLREQTALMIALMKGHPDV
jgi:ankyrin repeat protein